MEYLPESPDVDPGHVHPALSELERIIDATRSDRHLQIDCLRNYHGLIESNHLGPAIAVKIKFAIITAILDYCPQVFDSLELVFWPTLLLRTTELIEILVANRSIVVRDDIENEEYGAVPFIVKGCVLTLVEQLDHEFQKLFRDADPLGDEYQELFQDEQTVCGIIDMAITFIERQGATRADLCRIYILKIQHTYFKTCVDEMSLEHSMGIMLQLGSYVEVHCTASEDRLRILFALIFHSALNDNLRRASSLISISHVHEAARHADAITQTMYLRAMAQLGMCFFRKGLWPLARRWFEYIMNLDNLPMRLGQAFDPTKRNILQYQAERDRQFPPHMFMDLEGFEFVAMVSAMLREVPKSAKDAGYISGARSKYYYNALRWGETRYRGLPLENTWEHIVAASRAMQAGHWRGCINAIINEQMNVKVWNRFYDAEIVKERVASYIKLQTFKTYIYTLARVWDRFNMEPFAEMFELTLAEVYFVIKSMITKGLLQASLEGPNECLVVIHSLIIE